MSAPAPIQMCWINVTLSLLLLSQSIVHNAACYMTTSEQWSVISRAHSGASAEAFGLSTPIQGLNQSQPED